MHEGYIHVTNAGMHCSVRYAQTRVVEEVYGLAAWYKCSARVLYYQYTHLRVECLIRVVILPH